SAFGWLSTIRARLLEAIPFLVPLDWQIRKFLWSVTWASVVILRLWPRKPPVPREEQMIRLIPAPASYSDFKSPSLVVPNTVPSAEATLLGSMTIQTLHLLQDIYPVIASHQAPASHDPIERLRGAYSWVYRLVRTAPVWHPNLVDASQQGRLLETLAVGGP